MFMTSLRRHTLEVYAYFGMHGKRRPIAMVPIIRSGVSIFKFTGGGGGNQPLGKPCYRKRLDKTRVKGGY